jgi:CheY-like chemotaxis protein
VLVIDDNVDAADMLTMLIEARGYAVETRYEGQTACEILENRRLDAAFIDIGLPGADGYEVARRARAGASKDALLVAVTAYGSPEARALALEAGFDEHIKKPLSSDRLEQLLSQV